VIEDRDIEKVLDWLVHEGKDAAQARADRIYCEEFRKSLKAQLMKESGQETVSAQEREAYASPAYITHLKGLREAVFNDERYRWLMTTAEAKIEAWRTMQANQRIQSKVG
jgi:hypothetical protein